MEFVKQQKLSFQKPGETGKVSHNKSIDMVIIPPQNNKNDKEEENIEETQLNKNGFFWN